MRFSTTFRLFVGACLLAGLIWFFEWRNAPPDTGPLKNRRVLRVVADDVRHLMIQRGALRVDCMKRDGTWALERPIRAKADDGMVERILSELEAMPRGEVITVEQCRERELGLKDYGLLEPQARFAVDDRLGREEVLIGDNAPLGALVYVKLAGADEIIATRRSILDVMPAKVEDLRDRSVLRGNAAGTTRLEIQGRGKGFIQATRTGEKWSLQQPIAARGDNELFARLLNALYALKVQQFVWDPMVESVEEKDLAMAETTPDPRVELYGLGRDEAAARITIWANGDEAGKELVVGKPVLPAGSNVYVRCGDSVYTVTKEILDVVSVGANDLRDRILFSMEPAEVNYAVFKEGDKKLVLHRKNDTGWMLVEPTPWKADDHGVDDLLLRITRLAATGYLESSQTNPAEFGLSPPAYIIQVSADAPTAAGREKPVNTTGTPDAATDPGNKHRLLIGAVPSDDKPVFAKFDDDSTVFQLASEAVRSIVMQLSEPLAYRDRTMLVVSPENVKRVSLSKNGKDEQVVRDDAGAWTAAQPATNRVNLEAVEEVLLLTSNLRALRIESDNPKTLAACGLDQAGMVLTLGLSGAGIQKSILIGFRAKTDGVYAMIQGEDVVFVLENGLMERLTQALTRPPSAREAKP